MRLQVFALPLCAVIASCGGGGSKAGGSDASQVLDAQGTNPGAPDAPSIPDLPAVPPAADAPGTSDSTGLASADLPAAEGRAVDATLTEPDAVPSDGSPPDRSSAGGAERPEGGTAGADTSSASKDGTTGSPTDGGNDTCLDILACIANCPDADAACPDDCYARGSDAGQSQLLGLLTCMDQGGCADVTCIETVCNAELKLCLDSGTTASGSPNPGGVPAGSIPPELVGRWTSPGSWDVTEFTFSADGTATYSVYKESGVGSCSMSVYSQWKQGSAVASGDHLTVTLAAGTTSVAWVGGCGSGYTNPAEGKILEYSYTVDLTGSTPGLWLTDLSCTGSACETYFKKSG